MPPLKASSFRNPSNLFYLPPPCLPWSFPVSLAHHFETQRFSWGIILISPLNMSVYHHTLFAFARFSTVSFNPSMFIYSSMFFLSTSSAPDTALTITLSVHLRTDTLFSLKHHVSLPCSIVDLTPVRWTLPFINFRVNLSCFITGRHNGWRQYYVDRPWDAKASTCSKVLLHVNGDVTSHHSQAENFRSGISSWFSHWCQRQVQRQWTKVCMGGLLFASAMNTFWASFFPVATCTSNQMYNFLRFLLLRKIEKLVCFANYLTDFHVIAT